MSSILGKKIKNGYLAAEVNRVFLTLDEAGALLLRNKKIDIPPMMQTKLPTFERKI